jgi:hypothetical protein
MVQGANLTLVAIVSSGRSEGIASCGGYLSVYTNVTTRLPFDASGELPWLGHFQGLESSDLAGHTKVNTFGREKAERSKTTASEVLSVVGLPRGF